jgi:hypothetical protein
MKTSRSNEGTLKQTLSCWSSRILIWSLVVFTMLALQGVIRAQTYGPDGTFNFGWTAVPLPINTTGSTTTTTLNTMDGVLPPSRRTVHTIPVPPNPAKVFAAHLNSTAIYDPATQGAIVSLSYSYDLKQPNPPPAAWQLGIVYSILVFQNNTYYRGPLDIVMGDTWQHFPLPGSQIVTAASFSKLYGPSPNDKPDFSCKGSKIQFGYTTANSTTTPGLPPLTGAIDNWKIQIEEKKDCCGTADNPKPCCGTADSPKPCCATVSDQKVMCDKGAFNYTFTVTNNSTQQIQYLLLSPPPGATYTISPSVKDLGGSPLSPGQSTSVSVTINNASSGNNICINVSLADNKLVSCCTVQTCVTLPDCPCLKMDHSINCGKGGYTLTFSITNQTGVPVQQIFAIASTPSGLSISPQPVTVPTPLPPGQIATFTLSITGAPGGTNVCLRLTPLGTNKETCCSVELCFKLPDCPLAFNLNSERPDVRVEIEREEPAHLFQSLLGAVLSHGFYFERADIMNFGLVPLR